MRRGFTSTPSRAQARPHARKLSRARAVLALLAFLPGCSSLSDNLIGGPAPTPGQAGFVKGFLGGVVADEPRAVLAGQQVLSGGGTAADAAVEMALTLSVTLPSRAGLGGGGGCLAYSPDKDLAGHGVPQAVMFAPIAPAQQAGDRPAAVPTLVRGLFVLHRYYGKQPFESLISSAEQMARFGIPASRALVKDLNLVSGPLLADPGARAVFSQDGVPLTEGQMLRQPDLGSTLAQIRVAGVGDFYQGNLARRIAQGSAAIGGPLTLADIRAALPRLTPVLTRPYRNDRVAFLPSDGGLGAAAAFDVLAAKPTDTANADARAAAVIARFRAGGATPEAILNTRDLPAANSPAYPASTSFVALDRAGNAVACVLTLDNLFGTGRMLPGLGFLAAASPAAVTPPLLSAGLVWSDREQAFRAVAGGSGQAGAPVAVAAGLVDALTTNQPMSTPVPDPGRANVIACSRYLPGSEGSCGWANDPREAGLAMGAN